MPKEFDKCVKAGGKIVRLKPRKDVYLNVCYDSKGKAHSGKTHHMKEDAEAEIQALLQEESSTANTAANSTATMGGMLRKTMPKGKEMSAKDKKNMKKKMKKATETGKMCAEGEANETTTE